MGGMSRGGLIDRMEDSMARTTGATHQGIWRSLVFASILRALGLCAFISMLALPLKSYAVDSSQLGLDSLVNFAAYANGSLTVNGPNVATINGDVGLGPNGTQNFGTAFTINGTYQVDNTANNSHAYSGAGFSGGTVVHDIDSVGALVSSVSTYAAGLSPNLTFTSSLSSNYTFVGNGGYNVISLPRINYNSSQVLTLQGGANDVFVFNVALSAIFSGATGTPIVLDGVATNHVLFNLRNPSASSLSLNSAANVTLFGTFIAPSTSISLSSDTIYGGLFAGGNNLTLNGSTITADVFAIPEPSSFALVGITCLFGLGLWSRRRHGDSA